jgi:3-oxo-4,17-pregnadiene-20-carboxyl-CoA hydratase alpha subunit
MPDSMTARHPRPGLTADNGFFWEGLAARRLLIQRCASCRRLQHPPAPMCPACHGLVMEAIESAGRGVIHSFVVVEHPRVPPFVYPNVIVLVELAEGTRLVSRLVGTAPEEVRIGLAVQVDFETVDGDLALHFFRVVQDS